MYPEIANEYSQVFLLIFNHMNVSLFVTRLWNITYINEDVEN